ncbi:MAG: hypothetical protein KDA58_08330 [Planctomycetaceae bacterium]|nr:hypothetical protein [Planctomycetaceae bacterium]
MSRPLRLAAVSAVIAIIWLGVLPQVADWPAVRDRIERHQQLGLDPQAIFYSEQPDTFYAPIREAVAEHPEAFW